MFCIKCGKPLAEGALFCAYCGAKVVIPAENGAPADTSPSSPGTDPSVSQYTAANAAQYSVRNAGQNAAPRAGQYSAPNAGQYNTTNAGQYTAPNAGQNTAPGAGQYSAPNAGQYSAPNAGQYGAPNAGQNTAPGAGQYAASGAGQYSAPNAGQNAYSSYSRPNNTGYQAPRQDNRPAFDIAEFWKTHCNPILATHNESMFMDPQKWYAGSAAGVPRDVLEKTCSFVGGGSIRPEEIIALVIMNPNVMRNAAGRIGFAFCRDRFCYKGSGYNPRDGYKGMLIGGPLYTLAKSAGRKTAAIRYADIASLNAHGEYLDVFLKQGGKQTLYLEEKFNAIRTKAVFDELLLAMRS